MVAAHADQRTVRYSFAPNDFLFGPGVLLLELSYQRPLRVRNLGSLNAPSLRQMIDRSLKTSVELQMAANLDSSRQFVAF